MDFTPIFELLITLWSSAETLLAILGTLLVAGTAVDTALPERDLFGKLYAIPLLGSLLKQIKRFSPLNTRDSDKNNKLQ